MYIAHPQNGVQRARHHKIKKLYDAMSREGLTGSPFIDVCRRRTHHGVRMRLDSSLVGSHLLRQGRLLLGLALVRLFRQFGSRLPCCLVRHVRVKRRLSPSRHVGDARPTRREVLCCKFCVVSSQVRSLFQQTPHNGIELYSCLYSIRPAPCTNFCGRKGSGRAFPSTGTLPTRGWYSSSTLEGSNTMGKGEEPRVFSAPHGAPSTTFLSVREENIGRSAFLSYFLQQGFF